MALRGNQHGLDRARSPHDGLGRARRQHGDEKPLCVATVAVARTKLGLRRGSSIRERQSQRKGARLRHGRRRIAPDDGYAPCRRLLRRGACRRKDTQRQGDAQPSHYICAYCHLRDVADTEITAPPRSSAG